MKVIDLRSDTVTKPTPGMLRAMMLAEVGDDVYGDDPDVNKLEGMLASLAGMEAAVFAPTGTQSNLIGLMAHCERGDEYIVGQTAHTYMWEGGGAAVLGSIQPQPLDFENDGTLDLEKVAMAIKADDIHHPRTRLLCLENTVQGKVLPLDWLQASKSFCKTHGLASHLDGARVFNAVAKLQVPLQAISSHFDSISVCLSKGLGAPVGSVLCGSRELIQKARRWRKVLGGGMRQAGYLAAAGIYALENHIERLQDDHDNALYLLGALAELDEVVVDASRLQTNMFEVTFSGSYRALYDYLLQQGIIFPKQPRKSGAIRLVTHLDVSRDDVQRVVRDIKTFYSQGGLHS